MAISFFLMAVSAISRYLEQFLLYFKGTFQNYLHQVYIGGKGDYGDVRSYGRNVFVSEAAWSEGDHDTFEDVEMKSLLWNGDTVDSWRKGIK